MVMVGLAVSILTVSVVVFVVVTMSLTVHETVCVRSPATEREPEYDVPPETNPGLSVAEPPSTLHERDVKPLASEAVTLTLTGEEVFQGVWFAVCVTVSVGFATTTSNDSEV